MNCARKESLLTDSTFQMDVEGAEQTVFLQMLQDGMFKNVKQVDFTQDIF